MSSLQVREPALAELVEQLEARLGDSVVAVLLYGSCRRSRVFDDGLVDLYALVTGRRAAEGVVTAALGRWLPPNVYYLESDSLRCKCGVYTVDELERCVQHDFHSYVWGRLAQPVEVVAVRDQAMDRTVARLLQEARRQFLRRSVGLVAGTDALAVWQAGLVAAYGAELRVETSDRVDSLIAADEAFYRHHGEQILGGLGEVADPRRVRREWLVRTMVGKVLSLARLVKGMVTFVGAIDYIVWKLERHSGQQIEIPDRVRRWQWIFVWPFALGLWRRGIFR